MIRKVKAKRRTKYMKKKKWKKMNKLKIKKMKKNNMKKNRMKKRKTRPSWVKIRIHRRVKYLQILGKERRLEKRERNKGQTGISIWGFIFLILAWAYEVNPTLSTPFNFFATRIFNEVPRIINWAADTQPKWKDLKQKVFDSPTLEVSPMLATPNEVGMPFFAPFIETEKDILKEAEDELRKTKNSDHIASISLNRGMPSRSEINILRKMV
uniref:Protein Ycf2-like n=1 Tax=Cucumis melo TaxID=3656 RepID=A0A9I9EBD7_CUCME